MDDGWTIKYYETARGEKPVQDFIDRLEVDARTKVRATLKLLREFGLQIGSRFVKKRQETPRQEIKTAMARLRGLDLIL